MKTIIALLLICTSFVANADLIDGTKIEVRVDQAAYERVFVACVSAFKVDGKESAKGLDDAIKACDESARNISMRSSYTSSDGRYYVTATPIDDKK